MAIKPLRNKKTGKVHHISDKYLQIFPDVWEPAARAVEDGLVERESEKVVVEEPAKVSASRTKKKEATDA